MRQPSPAEYVGVTTLFYALALLLYTLRIWTRSKARTLGVDDILISFSIFCATGSWICGLVAIHYGLGRHRDTLTPQQTVSFIKTVFAQVQCYDYGITSLKIGICWQIMRIKGDNMIWRTWLWVLIAANLIVLIAAEFVDYLGYRPFSAQFDLHAGLNNFRISPAVLSGIWARFLNIWFPISDFLLAVMPILFIRTLHRPLREKIVLCVLLALGLACWGVTIPRLVAYFTQYVTPDVTYSTILAIYLSELELFLGLCAAAIPTLRRLFEGWLIWMGVDLRSNSKRSTPNFSWSQRVTRRYGKGRDLEKAEGASGSGLGAGSSPDHIAKPDPVKLGDETWARPAAKDSSSELKETPSKSSVTDA